MHYIIPIIVVTGFLSHALALPQSNFDAPTVERRNTEGLESRGFGDHNSFDALSRRSEVTLEKRLGLLFLAKSLFRLGKAGVHASHLNNNNRRSLDDLLEERGQLLEMRDELAHVTTYLVKKSGLERRASPAAANEMVRRLVNQRRDVDYFLELNARQLAQRSAIDDLD